MLFIVVKQRDLENIVLLDRIWKVLFVSILIDDLTDRERSCPFVIYLLPSS